MHIIAIVLIAFGCMSNFCAVVFLFIEGRRREQQRRAFQRNLEEIDYHLHRARMGRVTHDRKISEA